MVRVFRKPTLPETDTVSVIIMACILLCNFRTSTRKTACSRYSPKGTTVRTMARLLQDHGDNVKKTRLPPPPPPPLRKMLEKQDLKPTEFEKFFPPVFLQELVNYRRKTHNLSYCTVSIVNVYLLTAQYRVIILFHDDWLSLPPLCHRACVGSLLSRLH